MDAKTLTTAAYALLLAGVALIGASYALSAVLPQGFVWSQRNAEEYSHSAAELHRLTHEHGHSAAGHAHGAIGAKSPDEPSAAELETARERFAASQQRLDAAIAGRQRWQALIQWLGIALAAGGVGIALYLRLRALNDER